MRPPRLLLAAIGAFAVVVSGGSVAIAHHATVPRPAPAGEQSPHLGSPPDPAPAPPSTAATTPPAPAPRPPSPVLASELTLTDHSRPVAARQTERRASGRTLRVVVRRPGGWSRAVPVVIFVHGFASEPESYEPLLDSWAAAGYLVVAPELPDAAADLPGAPDRDIAEQARDVSFVLDTVLAGSAGPIDRSRIAAIGHSDGGSVAATLALNSVLGDPRFRAYAVLSGAIPEQVTVGQWNAGSDSTPMLVTVGDHDEYGDLPAAQSVFARVGHPSALVHVPDGDHLSMYIDTTPDASALRGLIVDFLDRAMASSTVPAILDGLGTDTPFEITTR